MIPVELHKWAKKHEVTLEALRDLCSLMGVCPVNTSSINNISSESGVSARERLKHAQTGGLLWRNNVGAMQDDTGRVVRYGLANESTSMNKVIKSSDLIGITPITISPSMVGSIIGQFTAIETKKPGWNYTGTEREVAQMKFIQLVVSKGGHAKFTNGS